MIEQNYKLFTKQADDYYQADYWRADEEYLVNKYFDLNRGKKLLVLGCGGGRTLLPLYKKGYEITAIDIVPKMVEAARKKVEGLQVKVLLMNATDLKFNDNSFDYVFFPFHGIDNVYIDFSRFFQGIARVLTPEGVFIFNSHNRWFLKLLYKAYKKYADYGGFVQYRFSPLDYFTLKKYFHQTNFKYRITMQKNGLNFKDKCYRLLPFLDRSIYFICRNPRKL